MAHNKIRLVSGRVPTTNAAGVTADRYDFIDLTSSEPNLGTPNTSTGTADANLYILSFNTSTPGNRLWTDPTNLIQVAAAGAIKAAVANLLSNVFSTVVIQNTTPSISNSTGALIVYGGVGIGGNVYVANTFVASQHSNSVNYIQVTGNTSGNSPTLSAIGSDTNLGLNITAKGSASIYLNAANTEISGNLYTKTVFSNGKAVLTAEPIGQAAYDTANSAQANTIFTQGVDTTQNAFTNAAFAQANSAAANTVFITGGLNTANANISFLMGVEAWQNTFTNAAFNQANSAAANTVFITGGLNTANANISMLIGIEAWQNTFTNAAFNQANSAAANTIFITGGLNTANANIAFTQGVDAWQNTFTNAAFNQANSAGANTVFITGGLNTANANIAFTQGVDATQNTYANASFIHANAAFVLATNALPNTGTLITINSVSQLFVSNTTPSVSNITGSLVTAGGMGVGGNVNITGTLTVGGVGISGQYTLNQLTANQISVISTGPGQNALSITGNVLVNGTMSIVGAFSINGTGIDSNGNLKANSITTDTFTANNILANTIITTGNIYGSFAGLDISSSGVVPGTYGSTSFTPVITIAANGKITSAISTVSASLNIAANTGTTTQFFGGNTFTIQGSGGSGISTNISATGLGPTISILTDSTIVRSNITTTGPQYISTDLTIAGNLIVAGYQTFVNTSTFLTKESLIELASNNSVGDVVDIGFYGMSNINPGLVSSNVFHGLIREGSGGPSAGMFYLFKNLAGNPTNHTISYASATTATLIANLSGGQIYGLANSIGVLDGGTGVKTSTGTGSVVLNVSPTFSGTVNFSGATLSNLSATTINVTTINVTTINTTSVLIGNLTYYSPGVFAQFASNTNQYQQVILQNSNYGSQASADFIVSTALSTDTTYYGDFGMNGPGYNNGQPGSLNQPNMVYVFSASSDLTLGTNTANPIHFVVGNGATDAMTIQANGVINIPGKVVISNTFPSSNQVSGALIVAGGVGIGDSLYANAVYSTGSVYANGMDIVSYFQGVENTTNSNISFIQGVDVWQNAWTQGIDTWQNTWIQVTNNQANAAFVQANSAAANTVFITGGLNTANANIAFTRGIDNWQNAWIQSTDDQANTAYSLAYGDSLSIAQIQGGLNSANANIAFTQTVDTFQNNLTKVVYASTNAASLQANSAGANTVFITGGLATANANTVATQGIDNWQNTWVQITQASTNGAFLQANSAAANTIFMSGVELSTNANISMLQGGLNQANANTAYLQGGLNTANANIAFTQGVDATQNANIVFLTSVNATQNLFTQAAFNQANNALPNTGTLITVNSVSQLFVSNTQPSISNSTGALIVAGGLGITGNVNIQGLLNVNGVGITGSGALSSNTLTVQTINVTSSNVSSSFGTGAIIVAGGLGVGGNVYANLVYTTALYNSATGLPFNFAFAGGTVPGQVVISSGNPSISNTTGALTITNGGGLGVTGNVNIQGTLNVGGVTITGGGTTGGITSSSLVVQYITATGSNNTTNANTGTIIVTGGIGASGNIYSNGIVTGAEVVANNGIFVNANTSSAPFLIPVGYNALSVGPFTATGTITVPAGSRWVIL